MGLIAVVLPLLFLGNPAVAAVFDVPTDDFYTVYEDHQLDLPAISGVFSNDLSSRGPCVAGLDLTGLQGHLPLDSLGPNGQVTFSPTVDYNGATSFTYTLGLVNGLGCDSTGNSATVTITVFEVNDPPAVLLDTVCLNGVSVAEDSGAFTDPGHCVDMVSFGPTDENNQSFDAWVVSSNHPELFAKKPSIAEVDGTFGRLGFTPAANANGTATVTVRGRDGGGTSDGGDDLSDPMKFKITITAVDDPTAVATAEPTDEPTPEPTVEQPPAEPTDAGPSIAATLAPTDGPTAAASPAPETIATDSGGPSLPILLGILLVLLVLGFGAALFVPKWRAGRRS